MAAEGLLLWLRSHEARLDLSRYVLNFKKCSLLVMASCRFCLSAQMTENSDCLWDDGVAPELALDFDLPNVSSQEALLTLGGVFLGIFTFFQVVIKNLAPTNPALAHYTDCVVPDYSDHVEMPLKIIEE
jgi:hypothetical protein